MAAVIPNSTVNAVLDGLGGLGFDVQTLRREIGLTDTPEDADALVPLSIFDRLWERACALRPVPELALEVGLHVPLGVFGAMDYLAASAETVGTAFRTLALHFTRTVPGRAIEIDERGESFRVLLHCSSPDPKRDMGDEFTIGILVNHFRKHTHEFPIQRVELIRPKPSAPGRFSELLQAPVSFQHAIAALELPARAANLSLTSSDPLLFRTLDAMSSRLGLAHVEPPLEAAVRARLRAHLPPKAGSANARLDAQDMAKALGMSERTLQRKLAEIGCTYQSIVESVLRSEAERLLGIPELGLAEVAHALGFADQSAFSRAFKRWTALTPGEWRSRSRQPKTS